MCAACATVSGHMPGSGNFNDVLANAQMRAARGDFDGADSLLAIYARGHAGTPEALETTYWRALYKVDPTNRASSLPAALAALDGYIADARPRAHLAEATTLRRTAAQLDALNRAALSASSQAKDAASAAAKADAKAADAKADAKAADANANATADAKDAEIRKLRDDLAKANAELERIRKRLGTPPPRP